MQSEQERVERIMKDMAEGKAIADKLIYDKDHRQLRPACPYEDPDRTLKITPHDMNVFAAGRREAG